MIVTLTEEQAAALIHAASQGSSSLPVVELQVLRSALAAVQKAREEGSRGVGQGHSRG